MTDTSKPLPPHAGQFRSIRILRNYCQVERQEKNSGGKSFDPPPSLGLDQFRVQNPDPKDQQFKIIYQSPKKDFFCGAQVSLKNHEMFARAVDPQFPGQESVALMEMTDACTLAQKLVGEEETGLSNCSDEAVSPILTTGEAKNFSTLKKFEKYCDFQLRQKTQQLYGIEPRIPFSLRRTQILNPESKNAFYKLRYESPGQDFFCEGLPSKEDHHMHLRQGTLSLGEPLRSTPEKFLMNDYCSLTQYLFNGEKELGQCFDMTEEEADRNLYIDSGYDILVSLIVLGSAVKILNAARKRMVRMIRPVTKPVLRYGAVRLLSAGEALLASAGAGGTYFLSPVSKLGWAGRLGWAGLSFGAGYLVGSGLDSLPKLWGGQAFSSSLGQALNNALGPAPEGLIEIGDTLGL